jgi:hypothetical protein
MTASWWKAELNQADNLDAVISANGQERKSARISDLVGTGLTLALYSDPMVSRLETLALEK